MNPPPIICHQRRSKAARWWWLAIVVFLLLSSAYVVANVVSVFRVNRAERALRDAVLEAAPSGTALRLEFSVGRWTLGLARLITSYIDLPPEARVAIDAVRHAEVGVYKFEAGGAVGNRAAMIMRADEAMTRRGWERIVGVMQRDVSVAVYAPVDLRGERLQACVLVINPDQIVIAGAGANVGQLIELAARHLPERVVRR